MNEMIERVAKALRELAICDTIEPNSEIDNLVLIEAARAAIEAMREPTLEMQRTACLEVNKEQVRPIQIHITDAYIAWRAMINAALKE